MGGVLAKKTDVIWNYVGTIMSLASGFILLPLLLVFLSDTELGLWYVFLAVGNLTQLFEFGFHPTFSRNIVYCMSGARKLSKSGFDRSSVQEGIDWHLLKVLMSVAKSVFALIGLLTFIIVSIFGSMYVNIVSSDLTGFSHWIAWAIFCVAIFLNLYYLYALTFLRGIGDIAAENKAKTFARLAQLVLSAVLLPMGFGLIGAALGYFFNGLLLRFLALRQFRLHKDIIAGLNTSTALVSKHERKEVFDTVITISWRDGVVQLAGYCSTQATSILSSLFLGLSVTGTLSVLQQLANAVYAVSQSYVSTFYPSFQSSFAKGNLSLCKDIVGRGIFIYWLMVLVCTLGIIFIVFPVLPLFRPNIDLDIPLYIGLTVYLSLWQHQSIFCSFIISTNRIPYLWGYLISAVLCIASSSLLMGFFSLGAWGLILGQGVVQLAYNNWRWPQYLCRLMHISYTAVLILGLKYWTSKIYNKIIRK